MFYVNAGTNQVSVKTSSPASGAELTVNGRTHTDTQFTIGSNSTLDAGVQATIYKPATNTLAFATAGANERLRIDNNGRVLINTTSNTTAHTQSDDLVVGNTSHGHDTGITIVSNPSYSGWLAFSDGTSADEQRKAGLVYQHSSDTLYLRNNGNQNRLRITSDGLIQAETRSAGVRRMILSGSPSNSAFNIEAHDGATGTSANTNQGELGLYYNDGTTLTDEAVIKFYRGSGAGDGYFGFNTGSNERLRITSRGYREIRNYQSGSGAFTNTVSYTHLRAHET